MAAPYYWSYEKGKGQGREAEAYEGGGVEADIQGMIWI